MTTNFTDADAKALCAELDVDTEIITIDGQPRVVVNEAGMRKLANHAPMGATAAHALIDRALETARAQQHGPLARIRTDVVALLADSAERTLTEAEKNLIADATRAEYRAAADQVAGLIERDAERITAIRRIRELAAPYFAQLPSGSTFDDVMPLMPPADRLELDALATALAIDGVVIVDRDT
ncbi:hypothetical protein J7F02_05850 [Streptomyces sp. ISL-112]|uniref:hypothetical protein n=1 Tax=unclassified Streptomyces TaxID=2593676 RepID=UPI001BE7143B|nr:MULTISPECIES: hypothetical protein [unclassified Streptomyces]MBT2425220.1 hypothetical protein [Streptomyces sp. ISL-112]MBT2462011.1 hypothetical protein [Streptomyces sp. ISL-63]